MKKFLSCILCVAVNLSVFAAETVAKFAPFEAGAKSLGYSVAAHESGGGFCVTGGKSWSVTDGVTVVLKYSRLPSTGDQALVTLAQSNDSDHPSLIGIGAASGVLKGIFQGELWTGGETTGKTLPESGTIVFVYYPDQSTRGVFTYDADGTELFKAKGLKSTRSDPTLGAQFDLGSTHGGAMNQTGFTIEAVEILKGVVASSDVPALIADFEKTEASEAFRAEMGVSCSGWFTDWSGEKDGAAKQVVTANGIEGKRVVFNDSTGKWHPYRSASVFPVKNAYVMAVYGTADMIACPAEGQYAVLWAFGETSKCNALAKDHEGNIVFIHSEGNTVSKKLTAGPVSGYHLFTVVFDKDKGCGLYIDDNAGVYDPNFTALPIAGWQIGSVYRGLGGPYVRGDGFVPLNIWASEEAFIPMVDQLAKMYPAVTTINANICFETNGGKLYLPSLTNTVGNLFQMKRGTLIVPAAVEATLDNIEFGDKDDNPTCGLELDGVLNIVKSSTGACTDAGVYRQNNANNGVLFGEWTGTGTYNIRGTFNATNAYVDLVHDAGAQTFNIDGGTFAVKGITAKNPSRATINLTNGGTISYGEFPSCAGVVKNYGYGTVTGTSSWTDTDDFTIVADANGPTTFAADGVTLAFTGAIEINGEYETSELNGGHVELNVVTGDVTITEPGEYGERITGARAVIVDVGAGQVVTFTQANTFTGGLTVKSGTARTTSSTGFGPNNYSSVNPLARITVEAGATLDLANTKDTCYILHSAGTIVNTGSPMGDNSRQTTQLYLTDDTTVSGATFGLLSANHGATLLGLGGHTLTVDLDSDESQFHLSHTTIQNPGVIKMVRGRLWVNPNKAFSGTVALDLADFTSGLPVVIGSAEAFANFSVAEGQPCWSLEVEDGKLVAICRLAEVDGKTYGSWTDLLAAIRDDSVIVLREGGVTKEEIEAVGGIRLEERAEGGFSVVLDKMEGAALRFSEIMPKPSDKPVSAANPATLARYDKNGLESGWVELENTSDKWVNLKDYKFCRANRGKVYTHADYGNFPEVMIPPHGRFTFYTSERYSNSYPEFKDGNTSAFEHGTFDGKPIWYNDMLIWGDKVNPKKFPYVTLVYRPASATADQILETVIIPSDTPEGYSIIVGHDEGEGVATQRWLCPSPTKNAENSDTTNLKKIGPNVGGVYGTAKTVSEFAATAPAKIGEPYTVSLNVNPVYTAAKTREADEISTVTLVYRTKLGKGASGEVPMEKSGTNDGGDIWTAEIPAADIPAEPGQLIQWKTKIADAAGNIWASPSFMNPDDGYEWFGTITEPGELNSAKLPTWHMFIDDASKAQMDVDADKQTLPNNARVAIYDASTSTYYDYVRIDLRGNSSAHFNKKSHGLRFSKAHPLMMTDVVTGKPLEKEVRKSSLIGEPADPSFMRQMIAFWLWDKMGNKVPFDFPVRCNLNGEFFQLGFHSERFTDELIEDVYGLDKYGYGYKNIGQMDSKLSTTAGGIEKKTPDDGNEKDFAVLRETLTNPMHTLGVDSPSNDNDGLTKFVVRSFNLPAWLNYIASARITQEMDDVWANISGYYDDAQMLEGERGTATWMPLGYDFNVSFGQYYHDSIDLRSQNVLMANQDWFKSHPFYGGEKVRCHNSESTIGTDQGRVNEGNRGIEAVLQSSKFRRLYLRRLRTLMDQELKAPGTPESKVPFMVKMREMAELMKEDAVLDHDKYGKGKNGWSSSFGAIDSWGETNWPATISNGVDDIWNNYVVPRQTHLYVTHSVTNTSKEVGYGEILNAGIPLAQSSLDALKEGLSAEAVDGGIVIRNANDEAVDLSGWDVNGPVVMKLPAGTVIDMMANGKTGEVFVVTDRRAYVATHAAALTDEVIVGNAKVGSGTDIGLTAADGTVVISADVILPPGTYHGLSYDVPVRLAPAGSFAFEGVKFNGGLNLGEGTFTLKNQNGYTNTASVVDAPTANIVFTGKGAFELKGEKTSGTLMTVNDLIVSNGVFTVESKAQTPETAAVYLNGSFAVEDKGTINLKLTKNAAQGRGFFLAQKDKKCVIASSFNATLNGPGCRALQIDKGSVNLEIKDGAKIAVEAIGADVRVFKGKGKIKVSGGKADISAEGAASEIFSADKTVEISGGTLNLTSTDDCVSATTDITISGGTINGTSTGGDVFDSNGTMAVTGGSIVGLAIGTEADGKSGQVFDVNAPNVVDFSGSAASIFAISGIDATLGAETAAETISGKTVKIWTAPEITGVETVKLFMMVNGQVVTLSPESWDEVDVAESTTVAELIGEEQAATLASHGVDPQTIVTWARTHSKATKPGEAIDLVAFALDCSTAEVDEKKKAFKVTISFDPETGNPVVTKAEGVSLNVEPTIEGSTDLIDWHDKADGDRFFKAVIRLDE